MIFLDEKFLVDEHFVSASRKLAYKKEKMQKNNRKRKTKKNQGKNILKKGMVYYYIF